MDIVGLFEGILNIKAETVTAAAAVVGLVGVTVEYLRQKRQSRIELAQQLIERLDTDEMIAFAVKCIDWGTGIIPVPTILRENDRNPSLLSHSPEVGQL